MSRAKDAASVRHWDHEGENLNLSFAKKIDPKQEGVFQDAMRLLNTICREGKRCHDDPAWRKITLGQIVDSFYYDGNRVNLSPGNPSPYQQTQYLTKAERAA